MNLDSEFVLDKIKDKQGLGRTHGSETRLAEFLGITPQRLRNWRTRNKLDVKIVLERCHGYDLKELLGNEQATLLYRQEALSQEILSERIRELTEKCEILWKALTQAQKLIDELERRTPKKGDTI